MKLLNRQTGETIVEVLISVAVLGLILVSTYALANQSGQANRQAQERAEALNENSGHLELFKTYLEDEGDLPTSTGLFCVHQDSSGQLSIEGGISGIPENAQEDPLTAYPGECKSGPEGRYNTAIRKITDESGTTYDVITRWDRASGGGVDELSLLYKLESASTLSSTFGFDPNSGISIIPLPECRDGDDNDGDGKIDHISVNPPTNTPGPDLGCTNPDDNDETNPQCVDGEDNDGDGRIDHISINPSNPDPGCTSRNDNVEEDPPGPANISITSHRFPSWHLYNTGGSPPTVNITVSNPSYTGVSNIGSVSLSGRTDSFQIISNGCANRSLAPRANCNVTVRFYPPSGPSNNYFGNSGDRHATLTVGVQGHANKTTALVGRTYSDRMRPGDQITQTNFGIVPYRTECYKNVEACGIAFTGIASNGNLYLGGTYCLYGGWGSSPYPGSGNRFAMQTDGNLVFYGIGGAYRYASWTNGSNRWLQAQQSGNGLYISHGSGGPLIKWIHYGGSCFAW
jgi:hypothetical protein